MGSKEKDLVEEQVVAQHLPHLILTLIQMKHSNNSLGPVIPSKTFSTTPTIFLITICSWAE
jgi:hypothetical protein